MPGALDERDSEIARLYREGIKLADIAARFGISAERARQIAVRTEGPRRTSASRRPAAGERVRLRIGNLGKAVLVSGQAYQDPKDALNEFVSNAADDYAEHGRRGARITVVLRRKGARPVIAIDDDGSGMDADRLRSVARNLFESDKAGDDRTLGEKAIGLLAFQQLGGRCEIVSRREGQAETWTLQLVRGSPDASLVRERRRARQRPGTTVYLSDLDPEVLRVLTQRKVVDYLRRRRAAALARGDYTIEVVEGRSGEVVSAEQPEGVRLDLPSRTTLWGRIEFALYVAADADRRRRVAVVGRAGTTVLDDLAELEEFEGDPWSSGQVSGLVAFDGLRQTAGRRAVLRDREGFPVFREAVKSIEPVVARAVAKARQEVDARTADRLAETVRKVFGKVLRELADLDNPMRVLVGRPADDGALPGLDDPGDADRDRARNSAGDAVPPTLDQLRPDRPVQPAPDRPVGATGTADAGRSRNLPSLAPDPEPGPERSRFDPDAGVVLYNEAHPDFLVAKGDEGALLDYLLTLVAKEYVVYNNPRAGAAELGEEMVRMMVRVRRHQPRRRHA